MLGCFLCACDVWKKHVIYRSNSCSRNCGAKKNFRIFSSNFSSFTTGGVFVTNYIPAPFRADRFYHAVSAQVRAPVAVSACLVGAAVRYDGTDKRLGAIEQWLDGALQLLPVCPEVGAGLGVPRPPVQLVMAASDDQPRARGRDDDRLDVTEPLRRYAEQSARTLRAQHFLCGYLFKSRSPSCGVNSAPLLDSTGKNIGTANGIQADYFQRELPWLVYCEESALGDERNSLRFILQCRLVFDVLHAGAVPLTELQQHYYFLIEKFSSKKFFSLRRSSISLIHGNGFLER